MPIIQSQCGSGQPINKILKYQVYYIPTWICFVWKGRETSKVVQEESMSLGLVLGRVSMYVPYIPISLTRVHVDISRHDVVPYQIKDYQIGSDRCIYTVR